MVACNPHTVSHLDGADPPPSSLRLGLSLETGMTNRERDILSQPRSTTRINWLKTRCFQLMHLLDGKSSLGPNPAHCAPILMRNKANLNLNLPCLSRSLEAQT